MTAAKTRDSKRTTVAKAKKDARDAAAEIARKNIEAQIEVGTASKGHMQYITSSVDGTHISVKKPVVLVAE